ncbi:MAG: hypothetical protein U5L98_13835 [Halomonas sp.]|nr:hypothetical protein [Halomonas sp.]MDZ7853680.1 hypothetical protein [Halomonas sp.]
MTVIGNVTDGDNTHKILVGSIVKHQQPLHLLLLHILENSSQVFVFGGVR